MNAKPPPLRLVPVVGRIVDGKVIPISDPKDHLSQAAQLRLDDETMRELNKGHPPLRFPGPAPKG